MTKTCIVCGKPIRKRTTAIYFKKAFETYRIKRPGFRSEQFDVIEGKPDGTRETGPGSITLYLEQPPTTKAEAQRYVNFPIVSITHGSPPYLWQATFWDGKTYESEFFHSKECAAAQGLASARSGQRFNWK